jgi:hypothetical protein
MAPHQPQSGALPPPPEWPPASTPGPALRPTALTRWTTALTAAAASAGLAGYVFFVDPNNPASAYPKCPLKALTGIDCPGCGGLRATHALLHGDIAGAFDHNILAVIMVPAMAYYLTKWVLHLFGRDLPSLRLPHWAAWALPISIAVFTVVRNLPIAPFSYLNSA